MSKRTKPLICPMCGSTMDYKKWFATHIWVCPDCPFAGIEYYNDGNTDRFKEFMCRR